MPNILWLIIMIPVSSLLTGIGIYAWKREKPMWFWSGSTVSEEEIAAIKKYVINPVESHEVPLSKPDTLKTVYEIPTEVETLTGFTALPDGEAGAFVKEKGLAMDEDDVRFCRDYFRA